MKRIAILASLVVAWNCAGQGKAAVQAEPVRLTMDVVPAPLGPKRSVLISGEEFLVLQSTWAELTTQVSTGDTSSMPRIDEYYATIRQEGDLWIVIWAPRASIGGGMVFRVDPGSKKIVEIIGSP